jgi:hypothetical protein
MDLSIFCILCRRLFRSNSTTHLIFLTVIKTLFSTMLHTRLRWRDATTRANIAKAITVFIDDVHNPHGCYTSLLFFKRSTLEPFRECPVFLGESLSPPLLNKLSVEFVMSSNSCSLNKALVNAFLARLGEPCPDGLARLRVEPE